MRSQNGLQGVQLGVDYQIQQTPWTPAGSSMTWANTKLSTVHDVKCPASPLRISDQGFCECPVSTPTGGAPTGQSGTSRGGDEGG